MIQPGRGRGGRGMGTDRTLASHTPAPDVDAQPNNVNSEVAADLHHCLMLMGKVNVLVAYVG